MSSISSVGASLAASQLGRSLSAIADTVNATDRDNDGDDDAGVSAAQERAERASPASIYTATGSIDTYA